MSKKNGLLERFHRTLVREISTSRPEYLHASFTVAEIYQDLIPYRSHRDVIGVDMNGDYENALLRLLGGEGGFLALESEPALREIQNELLSSNPNTGLFRDFAAAEVRLNPDLLDEQDVAPEADAGKKEVTAIGGGEPDPDEPAAEGAPAGERVPAASSIADRASQTTVLPFERPAAASPEEESSVSQCPQCRDVLPERAGLRFCPSCGTNVLVATCSSCGEELERSWRYCISCGTRAAR